MNSNKSKVTVLGDEKEPVKKMTVDGKQSFFEVKIKVTCE